MAIFDDSHGLIWLFIETIYYYPIYSISSSLFNEYESGLVSPVIGGRLVAFAVYFTFIFISMKIIGFFNNK